MREYKGRGGIQREQAAEAYSRGGDTKNSY